MLNVNEMPELSGGNGEETDEDGNVSTDNDLNFETLKAKFDAYGVAVRAGAITPSKEDEDVFRQEGGLPTMSPAVLGAWEEDKGFRRPITLVSGSSEPPTAANTDTEQTNDPDE